MIEKHFKGTELAALLGIHPETLRRHAAAGEIETVRAGKDRLYPESAVQAWLDRSRETPRVVSLAQRRQTRSGRSAR
mgnify:CR=1 FL=1